MKSGTTPGWHFNERRPGDKNREPIVGEFFATDVIRNPAEALVRESVQNTLDAASGDGPVRVRFYLSGAEAALPPGALSRYMKGGWPHFRAEHNGLTDQPGEDAPCPFLAVEDFGTTGLTGDPEQWQERPGVKNPFYYFFRAEGQSGKGEMDRGRWGVGKTVFPRSSRLNAFFALTVRHDDRRRMLMGGAVLRSHQVGDTYFAPDGYFGLRNNIGLSLPLEDRAVLDQFRGDFNLSRVDEPGLSIVVPWCDEEITFKRLVEAVVRQYYYPILSGGLHVTVATPEQETTLDAATLLEEVRKLEGELAADLVPLIELAEWANRQTEETVLKLAQPSGLNALRWAPEWFTAEQIGQLRETLEKGERVAVRVPVTVREKRKLDQPSYFDVFLTREGGDGGGRQYVFEGSLSGGYEARV